MTGERLLIVDDAPEIRNLLSRMCRRDGYLITEAASGEEAVKYLAAEHYPVAVVDLVMPGMGGEGLLRHIRQNHPDTDVIILTGYGELETAATTLSLGAYYYLQKESFNFGLVPLVVGRMLDRQRLSRANEQLIQDLTEANRQLARRRQQLIDSVQHISRALAGGLDVADIATVLSQALASLIECDIGGVLVSSPDVVDRPIAAVISHLPLGEAGRRAIQDVLMSSECRWLDREPEIAFTSLSEGAAPDEGPWPILESVSLSSRDTELGLCLVGRSGGNSFEGEELDILRILGAQGGIALVNTYLFARMRDLATRDSLTGLYNHGHFHELLGAELSRSERTGRKLAVIMIDLDRQPDKGLKAINDTYGHQAGDALLCQVADRLRLNLRQSDSVARYGGDEFVLLAPEINEEQALQLATRVWRRIRERPFYVAGEETPLTASVGVAVSYPGQEVTAKDVVGRADQACYQAKETGRDRVRAAWLDE